MGKSRFEGMEVAVREQAKIASSGISDKIKIEELAAQLKSIDKDTEIRIKELKLMPVDKELLKQKIVKEYQLNKEAINDRHNNSIESINEMIADKIEYINRAKIELENLKKSCKKDIKIYENSLENALDSLKEKHSIELSKLKNTDKTLEIQEEKIKLEGEREKQQIEIQLRSLRARDKINDEQKKAWEKLYNDTVEMSITQNSQS